jgi:hypothetical protein
LLLLPYIHHLSLEIARLGCDGNVWPGYCVMFFFEFC